MGRTRVWVEKKRLDRRFDSAGSTAAGSGTSPGLGGFVGGEEACARGGKAAEKCLQVGQALQALKVLVGFSVALTHAFVCLFRSDGYFFVKFTTNP